ncbi:Outer membrane lipoprotein carrier protein LolA [hydrothermal vent metagenome]|jgi:outer membrane lipoprotein carrier protein|uniref:Outer membrane lipoprotein carrier protein LolA n=1 Tax=hydrothermal vent metagenome TaxID=652676 RepID=A0A1W1DNJ8_9ZZZZ
MTKILVVLSIFWANTALSANHQFSDFFNSLESLKANFTQTTYSDTHSLLSTTSGTLTFKRPQQLRWHTAQPNEQILLLNNDELWLVDTELEQASLQQIQDLSQTPLYWLINKPSTLQNLPIFSHQENHIDWYTTNTLTQVLKFGFKDDLLHAISLKNELEQTVLIVFDQIDTKPNIEHGAFELRIDSGFDVIR